MKVKLKHAACIGGKDYKKGIQIIPDACKNDVYLVLMIKGGAAEIIDDKPVAVEQSEACKLLAPVDPVESPSDAVVETPPAVGKLLDVVEKNQEAQKASEKAAAKAAKAAKAAEAKAAKEAKKSEESK